MIDGDAVRYPFGDSHTVDLEDQYRQAQERPGLTRVKLPYGGEAWLATRMADTRRILGDPSFSRTLANAEHCPRLSSEVLPDQSLMALDPPRHTAVRQVLAPLFTVRQSERWRAAIRNHIDTIWESARDQSEQADIVAITAGIAAACVFDLLGLEPKEWGPLRSALTVMRSRDGSAQARSTARTELERYVDALLAQPASAHGGVLAALVTAVAAKRLKLAEAVNAVVALIAGGVGSPSTFLSSSTYVLLRDRHLFEQLTVEPDRIGPAVEELLRFVPVGVGGGFPRVATRTTKIDDTVVEAGEAVLPAMTAANRDLLSYQAPHCVRLDRGVGGHLAFGYGLHHCIGAHVARIEAQEWIKNLVTSVPDLRIADAEDAVVWSTGLVVRELAMLRVTW